MSDDPQGAADDLIHQVVSIVSAYVSHNSMRAADLPEFIGTVHASIRQLSKGQATVEAKQPDSPAVPVKRSVNKEFIICLECGKKFKSLRRHLSSFHNQTPDEYRAKWSLPNDYPMVAPAYSATRSQLAKDSGLGQVTRSSDAEAPAPVAAEEPAEIAETQAEPEVAHVDAAPSEAPPEPEEASAAEEPPKKARRGRPRKSTT